MLCINEREEAFLSARSRQAGGDDNVAQVASAFYSGLLNTLMLHISC